MHFVWESPPGCIQPQRRWRTDIAHCMSIFLSSTRSQYSLFKSFLESCFCFTASEKVMAGERKIPLLTSPCPHNRPQQNSFTWISPVPAHACCLQQRKLPFFFPVPPLAGMLKEGGCYWRNSKTKTRWPRSPKTSDLLQRFTSHGEWNPPINLASTETLLTAAEQCYP